MIRTLVLAVVSVGVSGCSLLGFTTPVEVEHPVQTSASGVEYRDVLLGEGDVVAVGTHVEIDYVATLEDGTEVDSTRDRGVPAAFRIGEAPIAGWDEGLIGMRVGGQRRLLVPPSLAYGETGVPGLVPANATLVFEVELRSAREE